MSRRGATTGHTAWDAAARTILLGVLALLAVPMVAPCQTVRGTLVDSETGRPIPFGLVLMFTESGDSVGSTISDVGGAFHLSSAAPGSFVLRAGALGYEERAAGVFDLGDDGEVSVRYGLRPRPLRIDELVVSLNRPATVHHLVQNGFVQRLQRGLGIFITPHDIEEAPAGSTEQLLAGLPGIRIGPVYTEESAATDGSLGARFARPDIGEAILLNGARGWCAPTVYVDRVRAQYDPQSGFTLSNIVGLDAIEGIEVYRRPAEIPVEYTAEPGSRCGVIVVWTRTGGQAGRRSDLAQGAGTRGLPAATRVGPAPTPGESVRMELESSGATASGVSVLEGTLFGLKRESLVVTESRSGRNVVIPVATVEEVQVLRERAPHHALVRGGLAGLGVGVGTWGGLTLLCAWSDCNGRIENAWIPATITGSLIGYLVYRRGPGLEWVATVVPDMRPGPRGVSISWALAAGGR